MTSSKLNALSKAHLLTPLQWESGCDIQVWGDSDIHSLTFTSARDGNWTERLTSHFTLHLCWPMSPTSDLDWLGVRVNI